MPRVETDRFNQILFDGKNHEPASLGAKLVPQIQGLRMLYTFLYKGAKFDELSPFVLDFSSKSPSRSGKQNPLYLFYMGGQNKLLSVTVSNEVDEISQGVIWAFPRSLQRGIDPYYWLELYNSQGDEDIQPFAGGRLYPNRDSRKTDFQRWHGIEEELIGDYAFSLNGLTISDLFPAIIEVESRRNLHNYRIAGRPGLDFDLGENSSLRGRIRLMLQPQQDRRGLYTYLDVVNVTDPADTAEKLISLRVNREAHSIENTGILDLERQLFLDFLAGAGRVSFSDLQPIYFTSNNYPSILIGRVDGKQLFFNYNKDTFVPGERGMLIPRQDASQRYTWLELNKVDPKSNQPVGQPISSGRVIDGKIIVKGWQGPEMQLFRDFADSKGVRFDQLQAIPIEVGGSNVKTLWREGDKRVYIPFSLLFGLKQADKILLVPEDEHDKVATFILVKGSLALGRYSFDKSKGIFALKDVFYQADGGLYDTENNIYTDISGEKWISIHQLAFRYGLRHEVVRENIVGVVRDITYKHRSSIAFYNEAEASKVLEELGYIPARNETVSAITLEILLKEYRETLLSGQVMSYEEFMNMKERQI